MSADNQSIHDAAYEPPPSKIRAVSIMLRTRSAHRCPRISAQVLAPGVRIRATGFVIPLPETSYVRSPLPKTRPAASVFFASRVEKLARLCRYLSSNLKHETANCCACINVIEWLTWPRSNCPPPDSPFTAPSLLGTALEAE